MFQCMGLGTHETGGCGEDWYHPGCLVGLGPKWYEKQPKLVSNGNGALPPISEDPALENDAADQRQPRTGGNQVVEEDGDDEEDAPLPDGFPAEDEFDQFLCYKCVEAFPWIKRYAGTTGFLPAVFLQKESEASASKKRKLEDDGLSEDNERSKRVKSEVEEAEVVLHATEASNTVPPAKEEDVKEDVKEDLKKDEAPSTTGCKLPSLPPAPTGQFSLFVTENFRDQFCRCASCFPKLQLHLQLLEEEETYEPPLTDEASDHGSTHGSGSLYDRGESALKNVDRVRAIEGVMAYNHLKERLKPFFQQFAGSGQAIGAEDIKEYFAKLRGDEQAIKDAGEAAKEDNRKEQSGY